VLIPIGDTPSPRNFTPYVNYALIGINVAVYLILSLPLSFRAVDPADPNLHEYIRLIAPDLPAWVSLYDVLREIRAYDLFTFVHGYKPGAPEITDLFFCMFLHGGFVHLAGNMLFLWVFGGNVEHRLGRIGYLLTYLATGVAATLTFALFAGDSLTPLMGASGAISGVLGFYFLLFKRNRVKVFIFLFPFFMNVILLPARWVLGFYVLIDNLLPFILGAQSGVAYGAHLGGFLTGLAVALAGEALFWRWPWKERPARPDRKNLADAHLAMGVLLLKQGQSTAAYQHLLSVFDHHPAPEVAARARLALAEIDVYRRKN
jgi:membrane associated rhomboid family serine protease